MRNWTLAFTCLAISHTALWLGGFPALHRVVKSWPNFKRSIGQSPADPHELLKTLDASLIFFPRRTDCLPYAAAGVCLLRCCGFPAALVIGVQHRPFSAHAWIELSDFIFAAVADQNELVAIDRL